MKRMDLKLWLTSVLMLFSVMTAKAASNETIDIGNTYDLVQNKSYLISGMTVNSATDIDSDFFFYDLDNSGSVRFLAIDGKYKIIQKNGILTVEPYGQNGNTFLHDDGTGSIKIIGGGGFGKPDYSTYPSDWSLSDRWFLAQVAPKIYRISLTVGKELNASDVNFKFYGGLNWDRPLGETADYAITTNSTVFGIVDTGEHPGNIFLKLKDGQTLTDGDTYVFTLDCTNWTKGNGTIVLDVEKQWVEDASTLNTMAYGSTPSGRFLKVTGTLDGNGMARISEFRDQLETIDLAAATLPNNTVPNYLLAEGNEGDNPPSTTPSAPGIFLRGEVNGWDTSWQFFDEGDGNYALYDKTLSGKFKIANADWTTDCNYGTNGESIQMGVPYVLNATPEQVSGNDIDCGGKTYTCKKILLTVDNGTATLKLIGVVPIPNFAVSKVLLPATVTKIGKWAFSACHSLRVVNIPSAVEKIDDGAFSYMKNLHFLSVDSKTATEPLGKINIENYVFQMYKENTTMPYDENDGLRGFYFGDNIDVDSIGYNSFFQHNQLESFKLAETSKISKLGHKVFINCFKLNSEDANNIIKDVPYLYNAVFYSCRSLTNVRIPSSVVEIENSAFGDCNSITDIYFESDTSPILKNYKSGSSCWECVFSGLRDSGEGNGPANPMKKNSVLVTFPENIDFANSHYRDNDGTYYGEVLRLLEKTMDENEIYDCVQQEHATVKLTRTFNENNWNTIVLPFDMTESQLKETFGGDVIVAEYVGQKGDNENPVLQFRTVCSTVANHPYLIMPSTYQSNHVYTANDVNINKQDIESVQPSGCIFSFTGNYSTIDNIAEANDVLYIKGGKFYYREQGQGSTKSKGFRAYFVKNASSGARSYQTGEDFKIELLNSWGETTNISDNLSSCEDTQNTTVYDLQGRKMPAKSQLPRGVYVVNGKKIVVK